jgi:hypothetical protein
VRTRKVFKCHQGDELGHSEYPRGHDIEPECSLIMANSDDGHTGVSLEFRPGRSRRRRQRSRVWSRRDHAPVRTSAASEESVIDGPSAQQISSESRRQEAGDNFGTIADANTRMDETEESVAPLQLK